MKVLHIYHSGFMVEMEKSTLLFDWYAGELPPIDRDKKLYVFCSHAHEDHYSPAIWTLQEKYPHVTYILDAGIRDAKKHPEADVLFAEPRQTYLISEDVKKHLPEWESAAEGDKDILIHTLASTDMGVAFYVETEGRRIYHAGDLNVWFWYDEPMEDNMASEKMCREEMRHLADLIREKKELNTRKQVTEEECMSHDVMPDAALPNVAFPNTTFSKDALLDVAFVPLDPRLREEAPRCVAAFMEILGADCVFPMHYWDREQESRGYLADPRISAYADRIFFDRAKDVQ